MYALVDCNNFFVSCERKLDKSLEDQPVVVLSNNDGCVISRSNEAKKLGIPMGAPAFKYQDIFRENNVRVFSAKFELYNYLSQEISSIVKSYAKEHEIYSIDELFLDFHGFKYFNLQEYCAELRQRIFDEQQIPVSIGIAPSKTLCKVANRIVKKFPEKFPDGVYILDSPDKIEKALRWLSINDVWGIGRRYAVKMNENGVYRAWDLLQKPEMWVRQIMGIHGTRMIKELQGQPQLILEEPTKKKTICVSRSFMEMISEKEELRERVETFTMYCAEKLRKQNSCCKEITVFIQTNRFRKELGEYKNAITMSLPNPSSSSIVLGKAVNTLLKPYIVKASITKKQELLYRILFQTMSELQAYLGRMWITNTFLS